VRTLLFALAENHHFLRDTAPHGLRVGDKVLQQFAHLMLRMVRTGDYVVRWDGEKFLLVFRPVPRRHVPTLGERIRRIVENHAFDVGTEEALALSCSIGLAEYPLSHESGDRLGWEQVVELAEAALGWVKLNGRDGWAQLLPTTPAELGALLPRLPAETQALIDSGRLTLLSSRTPREPG
jgi:diguanylate cyclase (GGDEF)-like protein